MNDRSAFFQKRLPVGATVQIKMKKTGAQFHGVVLEHEGGFVVLRETNGEESFIDYEDIGSGSVYNGENSGSSNGSGNTGSIESVQPGSHDIALASVNGSKAAGSSQATTQHQLISSSVTTVSEIPSDLSSSQIVKRIIEVQRVFHEHTRSAQIELHLPEFKLPVNELPKQAHSDWVRIKNKYDYARKINDENKRLPGIIQDLKDLATQHRSAPSIKSQLVLFLVSANRLPEALLYSMQAAVTSESATDWHNLAALALTMPEPNEMLACIALTRLFGRHILHDHLNAWYLYISLVQKTRESWLLCQLLEKKLQALTGQEEQLFLDTMVYLLLCNQQEQEAHELLNQQMMRTSPALLLQTANRHFKGRPSNHYYDVENELDTCLTQVKPSTSAKLPTVSIPPLESILPKGAKPTSAKTASPVNNFTQEDSSKAKTSASLQGRIYSYNASEGRGFLFSDDGKKYCFPRGAVKSFELLTYLEKMGEMLPEKILVSFESGTGQSGPLDDTTDLQAVRVWLAPGVMPTALLSGSIAATNGSNLSQAEMQTIDNIFAEAKRLGEEQKYSSSIVHIKRLLQLNPDYPGAKEYHTWLREQASLADLPSGPNPYAVAKRALQSKDLERAEDYFREAIRKGDHKKSAIKDLATLFMRVNKNQEAIDLLKRHQQHMLGRDLDSVESLLIQIYQRDNQFEPALKLMLKRYQKASREVERAHQSWSIANMYLRQNDYVQAQQWFQRVIDQRIEGRMVPAQISVALCLSKQQQYDQAEELLNQIVLQDLPTEIQEQINTLFYELRLLKSIGGDSARIDELINMTYNSDFSVGISRFASFFLQRCSYEGVDSSRVEDQSLDRAEINRIKALADRVGVQNPHDRSEFYLSAAKIMHELENFGDQNDLYLYLCRSFTSRGDAAVKQGQLEVVRELYSEALHLYDATFRQYDDPDAVCALTRFLYSTLGSIPLIPLDKAPMMENTLHDVFSYSKNLENSLEKIFDAITYLVSYSQFATTHILGRLYNNADWQNKALSYLSKKYGETASDEPPTRDMFFNMWNKPRRKIRDAFRTILVDLQPVISKLEINEASIQNHMELLAQIEHKAIFELDKRRIGQVRALLESMLELCYVSAFEDRDRCMSRIDALCRSLLQEIETSPTRLSVEGLCLIVEAVQRKISILREEIYKISEPQITIRHALERYTPDDNRNIKVQIVAENKPGCSPADALVLIVDADDDDDQLFTPLNSEVRSAGSLRGGQQHIFNVPIQVSELALSSQTFSLLIHVEYRTLSSGDTPLRVQQSFAIRLYTSTEFAHIDNPYAAYAKGHIVENRDMFFGRTELINNVYHAIYNGRSQNKSLIIYGQKRSGKSSILHHLETELKQTPDLLVVNIGNIGMLIDQDSSVRLLYQILWGILSKFRYVLEDDYEKHERATLALPIPTEMVEFVKHPSPVVFFKEIFERFKRLAAHTPGWEHTHVVLLIDEFSYVYGKIMEGKLSRDFMINWKALLQDNFFSAVLVAQDVVPKFKEHFPNEFGFIEDIRVNYLEVEDAIRLIDEPICIKGEGKQSRYREKAKETILELTAGSPYYIQIICNQLVNYMNNQHAELVTEADVAHVKQMLIEGSNSLEWPDFDNLVNSGDNSPDAIQDPDVKKVLIAIAKNSRNNGRCSLSHVRSSAETNASVDTILADLVTRKVVDRKEEQYYSIRVGLFREWLNARQ